MQLVSSLSSLSCNSRRMARLARTPFRNGGVILFTRIRPTSRECPLRAFRTAKSSVRQAGRIWCHCCAEHSRATVCIALQASSIHPARGFDSIVTVQDLTGPCMSHGISVFGGYLYVVLLEQFTSRVVLPLSLITSHHYQLYNLARTTERVYLYTAVPSMCLWRRSETGWRWMRRSCHAPLTRTV